MTRKDYELIAKVFRTECNYVAEFEDWEYYIAAIRSTAKNMADSLAKDNPRFDHDKFLKACGVE